LTTRDDACAAPVTAAPIGEAVAARYGGLAAGTGSLSCGGALELAAPRPGERLVDLGCGRGGDLLRAAGMVGPGGHVTGIDATPRMVEAAKQRIAGLPHATVLLGDLAAVPLPDGCAEVLISNCAINHATDKAAVYREVARLLVPGGRVVVSDVVSEAVLPESVRSDPAAWAACYGGAIPEADYLSAVTSAGLRDLRILKRSAPYEKGGVRVLSLTLEARAPGRAEVP
jgi:SAM-dependent methyltransferase